MLKAKNISKVYRIYDRPVDRILEALPFVRPRHSDFPALHPLDLEVEKGDTLGVVGPNGGGKSTLLQLLAGIIPPTTGKVSRKGRTAALLELGAGFNPEFSGRENVYINGEIMGLSRREIEASIPSIERFAGIGEFIERPVKTYSTGMHVRLAFATAIHVDPEILIVDEALAVGDAVFANRCIRKFEELRERGVTVVLVSHDLGLVKQLCNRAIFLMDGRVQAAGDPSDVINRYVGSVLEKQKAWKTSEDAAHGIAVSHRHGDGAVEIRALELMGEDGTPTRAVRAGERVTVRLHIYFHQAQPEPMAGILVRTRNGLDAFGTNTQAEGIDLPACAAGDALEIEFTFVCLLTPQEYTLTVAAQHATGHSHDWLDDAVAFHVVDSAKRAGIANLPAKIAVRRLS